MCECVCMRDQVKSQIGVGVDIYIDEGVDMYMCQYMGEEVYMYIEG